MLQSRINEIGGTGYGFARPPTAYGCLKSCWILDERQLLVETKGRQIKAPGLPGYDGLQKRFGFNLIPAQN